MSDARAAFLARFGHVAEGSPWVAERAWERGPFASPDAIGDAFADVVREAAPDEQLALIRAHPDLAGRAALAGEVAEPSLREQASAGLDRLSMRQLTSFRASNDAYRERFGFPFVMRVAGRGADEVLAAYGERLANDPETERRRAIEEIAEIMRLRIAAA